jgi:hypothetical protein
MVDKKKEKGVSIDFTDEKIVNPKTGHKFYDDEELAELKPKWRRQWHKSSLLNDEMIDICVDDIHTGPFHWPGNKIRSGATAGYKRWMWEIKGDWDTQNKKYTKEELQEAAKKKANEKAKENANIYGIEDDPFGFEYFLTSTQRKKRTPKESDIEKPKKRKIKKSGK